MQYRNGQFISAAAAVDLHLGFVPDRVQVYNYTALAAQTGVGKSLWINNVVANANALIDTYSAGVPTTSLITSNGITPVSFGGNWLITTYTITTISNANPGVVTLSAVTQTNGLSLANGQTITISNVDGMPALNTNRYIVSQISGNTFKLFDTFGNPVNTIGLGTYVSGGQIDIISYPAMAPVLNPINGQVITPGTPAGLQYDTGWAGVTLGTGVVGSSTNVIWWEAFYATPTGW